MPPEPTHEDLAADRTEDLSRFESEGGATEEVIADTDDEATQDVKSRDSDHRGRLLIVYSSQAPQMYVIADLLAVRLRRHGFTVEIGDTAAGMMPPPQDYDAVVLGLPMIFGHESGFIEAYIEHNRAALSEVPSALFTVSQPGTLRDHDPGGFLEQFLRRVAWQPDLAAAFAGGEPFPREGVLLRLKAWMGSTGAPPDSAALRTNWTDVQRLADAIAIELANAAVTAERSEPHRVAPGR